MDIEVVKAQNLTQIDLSIWLEIIRSNPSLASPFFSPFFTMAVGTVRQDVYVAKILNDTTCVGFFPFQRSAGGDGEPVGGGCSDCHGIVGLSDLSLGPDELIYGSDLLLWRYHHLLAKQGAFAGYHSAIRESPTVELMLGFEHYRRNLKHQRPQFLVDLERRERKLQREVGELTFEPHVANPDVLSLAWQWKREQWSRTFIPDPEPWEKELIKLIVNTNETGFRGLLSVLYAGGDIVAAHIGLASEATWHYWYPAYNLKYAKYSPGLLLLFRMIQETRALGFIRIDLGKTTYRYKRSFMNSAALVAEGIVMPFNRYT